MSRKEDKKMKKVLALLLVAVMALGLVACGGKTADGGVPTLVWYLPADKQADTALVCEEINKIIEPKIGAKIDIQYIASSDFAERMRLIMASQEEFDLCFTGFNNNYLDGVRRGGFMEITELLNEYGPELKEEIPDYLWEAANINGELYAIPTYQAMTKCRAAYFDKNLVDKYGFDVSKVKKMADIVPFLETIRDNEKGNFFPAQQPSVEYFYEDAYRYEDTSIDYIKLDSVTNEVIFQYDVPEIKNAREQLKSWRDQGFFPPIGSSATQNQCAVWFTDGYRPGDVEDRAISRGTPIVAAQISDFMMERKSANTTMTSISATSRHPEKAMQFLVEVNSNPDVFNLCAYGIEGKHYNKVGENHIEFIPDSGYAPGGNWKYGVLFNGYLLEGYADDLWDQIKAVNDNSRKAKLLGFAADTTPVVTNISQIASSLSEFKALQDGSTTNLEADTAAFEKKMDASGKKELVEYATKVINEYLASKK